MPPVKGRSKAQSNKFSQLGAYQKNKESIDEMEKKLAEQKRILDLQRETFEKQKCEIDLQHKCQEKFLQQYQAGLQKNYNKQLKRLQTSHTVMTAKLNAKKKKIKLINKQTSSASSALLLHRQAKKEFQSKYDILITHNLKDKRKRNPTSPSLNTVAMKVRRDQTLSAISALHGGDRINTQPTINGLLYTLNSTKSFSRDTICKSILDLPQNSFLPHLKDRLVKDWVKSYSTSEDNILRSMSIYYCSDVMGKSKYCNVRMAGLNCKHEKLNLPNLSPYRQLSYHINSIDIGNLHDVHPSLTSGIFFDEPVQGNYRSLDQYALRLASFYLQINKYRDDKLINFDNIPKKCNDSFLFVMAFGGDAAPGVGMSYLLSFLNVGERIPSSSETFLLFGSDCDECSPVSRRFVLKIVSDIKYMESKVFHVDVFGNNQPVEFKLGELPNDMKMMCFLAGEISNSAHFFTTFANVSKDDAKKFKKKFGHTDDCEWRPFCYEKRVLDAKAVEACKVKESIGDSLSV